MVHAFFPLYKPLVMYLIGYIGTVMITITGRFESFCEDSKYLPTLTECQVAIFRGPSRH